MSHFAQVVNGVVQQVIVAEQDFIDTLPDKQNWIQTSYNTYGGVHYKADAITPSGGVALRGNYAGVGFTYNIQNDVFYSPKPYPSWTISAPTWIWQPPTPHPNDGKNYGWDEATLSWVEIK